MREVTFERLGRDHESPPKALMESLSFRSDAPLGGLAYVYNKRRGGRVGPEDEEDVALGLRTPDGRLPRPKAKRGGAKASGGRKKVVEDEEDDEEAPIAKPKAKGGGAKGKGKGKGTGRAR